MSSKRVTGTRIEDQHEAELVIHDFQAGRNFLLAIGATEKAYQETRRESWTLDGASIDMDTWPGLATFVEVEAHDEATVRGVAGKLGYDWDRAVFGAVAQLYERVLGIPRSVINDHTPEITFANPPTAYSGEAPSPATVRRVSLYALLVIAYFVVSVLVLVLVRLDRVYDLPTVVPMLLGPPVALGYKEAALTLPAYVVATIVFFSFALIPSELRGHRARVIAIAGLALLWLCLGFVTSGVVSWR